MSESRDMTLEELIASLPSGQTPEGVIRHRARVEYETLCSKLRAAEAIMDADSCAGPDTVAHWRERALAAENDALAAAFVKVFEGPGSAQTPEERAESYIANLRAERDEAKRDRDEAISLGHTMMAERDDAIRDRDEWKRIADGAMADANQNAKAFIVGADVTFGKLEVSGCGDKGRCHGALKWCDLCGDVSEVCDSVYCDVHVSCASCGHRITQHGFAQTMGHEGRTTCLIDGCSCSWYTPPGG